MESTSAIALVPPDCMKTASPPALVSKCSSDADKQTCTLRLYVPLLRRRTARLASTPHNVRPTGLIDDSAAVITHLLKSGRQQTATRKTIGAAIAVVAA